MGLHDGDVTSHPRACMQVRAIAVPTLIMNATGLCERVANVAKACSAAVATDGVVDEAHVVQLIDSVKDFATVHTP